MLISRLLYFGDVLRIVYFFLSKLFFGRFPRGRSLQQLFLPTWLIFKQKEQVREAAFQERRV